MYVWVFFTIKHQLNVCNINDPSRNEEEPFFSKFLNPSPEAGDFQNLTTYHLSTDTSVEKILMKIWSAIFT